MKNRPDERLAEHFIDDLFSILSLKNLHVHTRRAVLYKAIEDFSKVLLKNGQVHWSEAAQDQYKKGNLKGYFLEHPVPKNIITKRITPADGAGPDGEQLRNDLIRAFTELMPICKILSGENKRLNAAGLKTRIPGDPPWESIDPWARYKKVEIPIVSGYNSLIGSSVITNKSHT